jgi:hypothetical protein
VLYTSERDYLHVSWRGYEDGESGIDRQEVTLSRGRCGSGGVNQYEVVKEMDVVPAGTREFEYFGLELEVSL